MKRILLLFAAAMVALSFTNAIFAQHAIPANTIALNLTPDQWRSDLRYFSTELLKRHKNAFHTMTKDEFDVAVNTLDANIPRLRNEEILVEFLRLIAKVGDGHTSINEQHFMAMGLYPLRFETAQNELYIKFGASAYSEIIGGRVIRIGKMNVKDAWKQVFALSWGDNGNEQSRNGAAALLLTYPTVLYGLNITETNEKVSITVELDGQEKTVEVNAVTDLANFFRSTKVVNEFERSSNPIPLYLKNQNSNFWSEYLRESKTLYVHINQTPNKPNETPAEITKQPFDF